MQATHLRVLENTWYLHGEGPLKERFLKEGLKPNSSTYLMANNYNFAEVIFTETQVIAEYGVPPSQIMERYKNFEEVDTFNLNKVCISGGWCWW